MPLLTHVGVESCRGVSRAVRQRCALQCHTHATSYERVLVATNASAYRKDNVGVDFAAKPIKKTSAGLLPYGLDEDYNPRDRHQEFEEDDTDASQRRGRNAAGSRPATPRRNTRHSLFRALSVLTTGYAMYCIDISVPLWVVCVPYGAAMWCWWVLRHDSDWQFSIEIAQPLHVAPPSFVPQRAVDWSPYRARLQASPDQALTVSTRRWAYTVLIQSLEWLSVDVHSILAKWIKKVIQDIMTALALLVLAYAGVSPKVLLFLEFAVSDSPCTRMIVLTLSVISGN
ncbi:hypothetical protein DYB28_013994 [Aphanomyces astaci]|uniref:Uncharacterized protein n=1 Tax=Aphanomyces astaci TaxID=112090 RepID=A0A9X8DNX9_APHAT|nr:hypothetical protein DYB28_013994 [Aphanomyces astaci]